MNDFWEWMEKNGIGEYDSPDGNQGEIFTFIDPVSMEFVQASKQMLIGYMMEYLREKEGKIILNTGGRATIEDVYDRYVKDIEKAEQGIIT